MNSKKKLLNPRHSQGENYIYDSAFSSLGHYRKSLILVIPKI